MPSMQNRDAAAPGSHAAVTTRTLDSEQHGNYGELRPVLLITLLI
jgi:hypothetical protein